MFWAMIFVGAFCWAFGLYSLSGRCKWITLSRNADLRTLEGQQRYREQNDVQAMNQFLAKIMFLPVAVLLTAILAISWLGVDFTPFMRGAGFGFGISLLLLWAKSIRDILGGKFARNVG